MIAVPYDKTLWAVITNVPFPQSGTEGTPCGDCLRSSLAGKGIERAKAREGIGYFSSVAKCALNFSTLGATTAWQYG